MVISEIRGEQGEKFEIRLQFSKNKERVVADIYMLTSKFITNVYFKRSENMFIKILFSMS